MEELAEYLKLLSPDEREALDKLITIAEIYPQSLTTSDKRFDSQANVIRQAFNALCENSR